jgi:hypothetical protein
MGNLLSPPSTGVPAVQDRKGNVMDFTPVWLKWFLDLAEVINKSGGTEGSVPGTRGITTEPPLVGGGDLTEDVVLSFVPAGADGDVQFNNNEELGAITGVTGTVTLVKLTSGGHAGSLTFTHGVITGYVAPT